MTKSIEFFFDLSSPWTYLAFHNIQPIAAEAGSSIRWIPILVGGVFNAVNPSVYALRSDEDGPKLRHMEKSVHDWAAWSGVQIRFPPPTHPAKSVNAMRVCCALEGDQETLVQFARATFEAYFAGHRDIDDPAVLQAIAGGLGLNGADLIAATKDDAIKDRLRKNTQDVIDRGGYGSPTIFVDGTDMYFGNDQIPLISHALYAR